MRILRTDKAFEGVSHRIGMSEILSWHSSLHSVSFAIIFYRFSNTFCSKSSGISQLFFIPSSVQTCTNSNKFMSPHSLEYPQVLHLLKDKVLERTLWVNNSLTFQISCSLLLPDPAYKLAIQKFVRDLNMLHCSMSLFCPLGKAFSPLLAWWIHSNYSSGVTWSSFPVAPLQHFRTEWSIFISVGSHH